MQQQVFGHFILNTFLFFISSLDTACNDQNDDNERMKPPIIRARVQSRYLQSLLNLYISVEQYCQGWGHVSTVVIVPNISSRLRQLQWPRVWLLTIVDEQKCQGCWHRTFKPKAPKKGIKGKIGIYRFYLKDTRHHDLQPHWWDSQWYLCCQHLQLIKEKIKSVLPAFLTHLW